MAIRINLGVRNMTKNSILRPPLSVSELSGGRDTFSSPKKASGIYKKLQKNLPEGRFLYVFFLQLYSQVSIPFRTFSSDLWVGSRLFSIFLIIVVSTNSITK